MEYIKGFDGFTATLGFKVKIYKDSAKGDFFAKLDAFSPGLAPKRRPGKPTETMKFIPQEELRNTDLDVLIEKCKERIIELGGEVVTLVPHQ
jgi:hypothetical protein